MYRSAFGPLINTFPAAHKLPIVHRRRPLYFHTAAQNSLREPRPSSLRLIHICTELHFACGAVCGQAPTQNTCTKSPLRDRCVHTSIFTHTQHTHTLCLPTCAGASLRDVYGYTITCYIDYSRRACASPRAFCLTAEIVHHSHVCAHRAHSDARTHVRTHSTGVCMLCIDGERALANRVHRTVGPPMMAHKDTQRRPRTNATAAGALL